MTVSDNVLVEAGSVSQVVVNRAIIVNTSYSLNVTILSKPNLEQQQNGTTVVVLNLTGTVRTV